MVALNSSTFFENPHSRARSIASTCTEASRCKSLHRIEMRLSIYESRIGLDSFSRDPIRYRGSKWNLYEFLKSHPTVGLDPSGLICEPDDCKEKTQKGNCGADITGVFSQYLAGATPTLKALPSDQVGVWDGLWWLNENGGNIDFWSRGGHPKCCATKGCANSVMLCGNCVRDTVTNNILFGFVAAAHGVTEGDASLGANVNNVAIGHGLEGAEQQNAYTIGYRLWAHYSGRGALWSEQNMCRIINSSSSDPINAFPLINSIKKPFLGCGDCGETLTLEQVGRKGIGTALPNSTPNRGR